MGSTHRSIAACLAAGTLSIVALGLTAPEASAFPVGVSAWRDPPSVQSAEPSGDAVPTDAPIVVSFNESVAPDSVSLSVDPDVGGQLTWDDLFTLRYQPIGLAHNATYHVTVHGRSFRGLPLRGRTSWDFTTATGAPVALAPTWAIRVPILMYHYIRINPDPRDGMGYRLSVTPSDFAAQMDWLARAGYHPVTTLDVMDYLNGTRGLPSKPVVLSFDDGYQDFFSAAVPILRAHDFVAVAYVVSGFIGQWGYMTAQEIKSLQGAGFEIGSHTVNHVDLTTQSSDGLAYQLSASKDSLEHLLGRQVTAFCYPYGKFGRREAYAVAAAGYQDATTTLGGSYRTAAGRYTWSRLRVSGGESLYQFELGVLGDS